MSRKAFLVQVELDVQSVTCPGVWLCSNGKVSLQIYMLDSCVQTGSYSPIFPIITNENFVFYKTFYPKHRLTELQKELHNQWIYAELVQWQSCEIGNVLATFHTTLDHLLYPSSKDGSFIGVDLDLLMEPSKTFPGTIAPKIEVSTKTTIKETLYKSSNPCTVIINPKVLVSSNDKPRKSLSRKVCHSIPKCNCNTNSDNKRPPFRYRKAEDDLILRKPKSDPIHCSCSRRCKSVEKLNLSPNVRSLRPNVYQQPKISPAKMCSCGSGHKENLCPVCAKYKGYFNVPSAPCSPQESPKNLIHKDRSNKPIRTSLFDKTSPKTQNCDCIMIDSPHFNSEITEKLDYDESCGCCTFRKPTLAEKLHAKLTKTLSSIPKTVEQWSCCCDLEDERTCPFKKSNKGPRSRADLYQDLQKFYEDLYKRSRCPNYGMCGRI